MEDSPEYPVLNLEIQPFEAIPTIDIPEQTFQDALPAFLARAAVERGPIFRVARRNLPRFFDEKVSDWVVYLVGPDANKFVLKSHRQSFSNERGWTPFLSAFLRKGLLNSDEPEHGHDRRIMNPAFSNAYIARYIPIVSRIVEERTGEWLARGEIDLYDEARKITFDAVAQAVIGIDPGEDTNTLQDLFFTLVHSQSSAHETPEEFWQRRVQIRRAVDSRLRQVIEDHRRSSFNDVLGLLLNASNSNGEPFSQEELIGQVGILLVAGHETTTTLVAKLLYLLSEHRAVVDRVHEELDTALAASDGVFTMQTARSTPYLTNAVNEALRLSGPAWSLPRVTTSEVEFAGYSIPAGTSLFLPIAAGHLLPSIFRDPFVFDPDRFASPREEDKVHPYAFVPFSSGPRVCIGINFAQVEAKVIAAHVLRRFSVESVPEQKITQSYYHVVTSCKTGIRAGIRARTF
jgi:retinoid hydroxylase